LGNEMHFLSSSSLRFRSASLGQRNGITTAPAATQLPHLHEKDPTSVDSLTWSNGDHTPIAVLYTVHVVPQPGNLCVLLGNGDGTLQSPSYFPVGTSPASHDVGDLRESKNVDVALANRVGNSVSLMFNNGDGTFAPESVLGGVGSNPSTVLIDDVNLDGYQDLTIAAAYSDRISVFLGNGDGTFGAPKTIEMGAGTYPAHVVVADFDGDGIPDLAVALFLGDQVVVLGGNGDGTFGPK